MICLFFFKQKTAYDMRISDWSSDVCSSDLPETIIKSARLGPWSEPRCRNRWASFNEIVFDEPAQLPAGRRAQSRRFEGFGSCALKEKIATGREIKADDVRANNARSEEHTSELQSLMRISYAVFCLTK